MDSCQAGPCRDGAAPCTGMTLVIRPFQGVRGHGRNVVSWAAIDEVLGRDHGAHASSDDGHS